MVWRWDNISFIKYRGNPLNIPTYEGKGVVHPSVVYFPEGFNGYKFWLYYTPFPPESAENPCLVRSNDGINFTDKDVSNPLITPSVSGFDENYLADPDVIYVNGRFYMLYVGVDRNGIGKIGLAESCDGVNFIKYKGNPILTPIQKWKSNTSLLTPTACYSEGKFHVLYEALKKDRFYGHRRVCYAFGNSLHHLERCKGNLVLKQNSLGFSRRAMRIFSANRLFQYFYSSSSFFRSIYSAIHNSVPWDAEVINHFKIIGNGEEYYLFYIGRSNSYWQRSACQLGLAKSKDLMTWKKYEGNPILSPSTGWESKHIYRASPVIVGNKMYLYYSAFSSSEVPRIGLAFSDVVI
jgi:predicted GH43/DUF377 family glycosyl hydrolase